MEALITILKTFSVAVGATQGTITVGQWLVNYLKTRTKDKRSAEVLQFLQELGCTGDKQVQELVRNWSPPTPVAASVRDELTLLLTNLVRGARFHTTQGTALSSYLRCERLIEQLLANLEPKRRAGQLVAPGRTDWKLERFLGMGAFGEVWLGRNAYFPYPRAFKFFTSEVGQEWLKREAEVLSHIKVKLGNHSNVIEYVDIAVAATPYPYLMLDYVGGGSLEQWILDVEAERKHLDVADLIQGIARGLTAAHRHGIYHRDLKPANILLTDGPDPTPKIADFGLSKVDAAQPAGFSSYVSQNVLVGTRMYLPPEAADPYVIREPAMDDVFAIGVVWYQVLTGKIERPPYDFAERLLTTGVTSRTVRLVSRCLAHPSRRFRDAGELLSELEGDEAPLDWQIPKDGYDVAPLAREFIDSLAR